MKLETLSLKRKRHIKNIKSKNTKKEKKFFDDIVDYNDQLIICENCLRPIIVWDVIIAIPKPRYCKTCLKYAML